MCILTSLMALGEHATAASAASLPASAASLPPFLSVRRRHTTCFRCLCRYSLYLLYWYKSTSTDADTACFRCLTASLLSRPAASYLHPQSTFWHSSTKKHCNRANTGNGVELVHLSLQRFSQLYVVRFSSAREANSGNGVELARLRSD